VSRADAPTHQLECKSSARFYFTEFGMGHLGTINQAPVDSGIFGDHRAWHVCLVRRAVAGQGGGRRPPDHRPEPTSGAAVGEAIVAALKEAR